MTETPKCPYCGAEMKLVDSFISTETLQNQMAYRYSCEGCKSLSPREITPEEALSAALHRTEPDETCKQLCESFGASANATVRELFDAIEQLNSSAEPKEDERSV